MREVRRAIHPLHRLSLAVEEVVCRLVVRGRGQGRLRVLLQRSLQRRAEIGCRRRRVGADLELPDVGSAGDGLQHDAVRRAIGQRQTDCDAVAGGRHAGELHIERLRRRPARRGQRDRGAAGAHCRELETKRVVAVLGQRHIGRRATQRQPPQPVADIGLLPLRRDLLEPGLARRAIKNAVHVGDRRLVGHAAAKQVAAIDVAVEDVDDFVEAARRLHRYRPQHDVLRAVAVGGDQSARILLQRAEPGGELVEHVEPAVDHRDVGRIAVEPAHARADGEIEITVAAEFRQVRRLLPRRQLRLQRGELVLHARDQVHAGLDRIHRAAHNGHTDSSLTDRAAWTSGPAPPR